jgi:hypothetical protein
VVQMPREFGSTTPGGEGDEGKGEGEVARKKLVANVGELTNESDLSGEPSHIIPSGSPTFWRTTLPRSWSERPNSKHILRETW